MTFFKQFVDYNANNIIFIRFKKIDNKIHDNVLLIFVDPDYEN